MLPLICFFVDVSKSNSSRRLLLLTTTTRVSSGWVESINMRLAMGHNSGARRAFRAKDGRRRCLSLGEARAVSGHSVERRYCLSDGHVGYAASLRLRGFVTTGRSRASRAGSGDAPRGAELENPAATPSDGSKALPDGPRYFAGST